VAATMVETTVGIAADVGVAVTGHRRLTSAIVVGSWATGLVNAGPTPRRISPTTSKMRRRR
jgi:hypothetical protein